MNAERHSMNTEKEFRFERIPSSSKGAYCLTITAPETVDELVEDIFLASSGLVSREDIQSEIRTYFQADQLSTPVLVARGAHTGKTLVVTAGVHGDEYEGMEAVYRIFEGLEPSQMKGTFLAVPIVTQPAFWLGTRLNPLDSRNMARVFPGSEAGSSSERLAEALLRRVLRFADLYIDLHSAGRNYHMLTLCGYCALGTQAAMAREGALCFGAPVVWEHPSCSPGRTISATLALGISSLYVEAYGGGHAREEDIVCYTRGLANVLKYLGIADLSYAGIPDNYMPSYLCGSGNIDVGIKCAYGGLFFPSAVLGARVRPSDRLGIVRKHDGRVAEQVLSPKSGVVVMIRATPRVYPGELIAVVADEKGKPTDLSG